MSPEQGAELDHDALEGARAQAPAMFDRIARTYDTLNGVLSFGMHRTWRRRALTHVPDRSGLRALDVATGTADVALALLDDPRVAHVTGCDLSTEMLARGREKVLRHPRADACELVVGDALALPFEDGAFDLVTISFGIRNLIDTDRGLQELRRVLAPGGRLIVLEFSTPEPGPFNAIYDVYRRSVLPRIGGALSGDARAYRYLDRTIAAFPSGEAMLERLSNAGLLDARRESLALGAVSIYLGER